MRKLTATIGLTTAEYNIEAEAFMSGFGGDLDSLVLTIAQWHMAPGNVLARIGHGMEFHPSDLQDWVDTEGNVLSADEWEIMTHWLLVN